MKKEVILAIAIGFGLGLVITYGVWMANKSLKSLPAAGISTTPTAAAVSPSVFPSPSVSTTPTAPGSVSLQITSPIDEWLADKDNITLTGLTTPNALVALTYEGAEQFVSTDASGNFSAAIPLDGGYNLITATAYDKFGNSSTSQITVTYTTSKI